MATNMDFLVNIVNADVAYATTPADYGLLDLSLDYLIWSKDLADLMTHEPTATELNQHATIIDPAVDTTVAECLWMNYSHDIFGSYYTHLVKGMSENKKFSFCFSFDGATATEPQLEAWDDSGHTTFNKNVLGLGTANNSFVKGVCTTSTLPGSNWVGTPLAGGTNVLLLNDGNGALSTPGSGLNNDLYANLKIVIPAGYATPAVESFVFTIRYTYL
jgi:hypothetical protein